MYYILQPKLALKPRDAVAKQYGYRRGVPILFDCKTNVDAAHTPKNKIAPTVATNNLSSYGSLSLAD